jgi:hypothetical protein
MRREAPPNLPSFLDSADIQSLKKILAVVEAAVHQDSYAQQINTQQILASANKGSMQGPSRYDEMMKENRGLQQAESKSINSMIYTPSDGCSYKARKWRRWLLW